jgi:small-conductance mechanosensitive channel
MMLLDRLDWRWLDARFLGSSARAWIAAAGVAAASYLAFLLIRRLIVRRVGQFAGRTASGLDDLVVELARRTRRWLLLLMVVYFGSLFLNLPHHLDAALRTAAVLALLVQLALWALSGIDFWVARTRRQRLAEDAASVTLIGLLGFIGKVVLGAVILLLMLDNLGVNVTALVAGLGVGGIAVALALQNILGDLLASLSIVLDKPFVLGDTINIGELTGTVENIGLKTTHLRGAGGEQIVVSNSDLLKSRIRNLKRMTERQVTLTFGVVYGTPAASLAAVPGLVREIVEAQEQVRFGRAHLKRLAEWCLEFEAAYAVLSPDYNLYMDRQQAINLALLRRLEDAGIALAFPTRTVHFAGEPAAASDVTSGR